MWTYGIKDANRTCYSVCVSNEIFGMSFGGDAKKPEMKTRDETVLNGWKEERANGKETQRHTAMKIAAQTHERHKIWLFNGNLLFWSALNWNDIPKNSEFGSELIFWLLTEVLKGPLSLALPLARCFVCMLACPPATIVVVRTQKNRTKQTMKICLETNFPISRTLSLNCFVTPLRYTFYLHYHWLRWLDAVSFNHISTVRLSHFLTRFHIVIAAVDVCVYSIWL